MSDTVTFTREQLSEIFDYGAYYRVPFFFHKMVSPTAAMILAFLMNQSNLISKAKSRDGEGFDWWFVCPNKKIEDKFGIKKHAINSAMTELQNYRHLDEKGQIDEDLNKGLIDVEFKGLPRKRWIRINLDTIKPPVSIKSTPVDPESAHLKAGSQWTRNQPTSEPGTSPHSLSEETSEKTVRILESERTCTDSNANNNGDASRKKRRKKWTITEFDRRAAKEIHNIAMSSFPHVRNEINYDRSSEHLAKMRGIDGISKREIYDLIKWYKKNAGKMFVPEAHSGETFRRKWIGLLSAKLRSVEEHNKRDDYEDSYNKPVSLSAEMAEYWNRYGITEQDKVDPAKMAEVVEDLKHDRRVTKLDKEAWERGELD